MTEYPANLQAIDSIRPIYLLPDDPFIRDILIPSFAAASNVDCMVGFFSSEVLASLAPGLATFINRSRGLFRLIISPILRSEDWDAIQTGVASAATVVDELFANVIVAEDTIRRYTLECLSWLIRQGRIEIQVALLRDGFFHPKVWLFHDSTNATLTAHGSSNLTQAGMHRNIEQVAVSRSWADPNERYTTQRLNEQFLNLWHHSEDNCVVIPMPEAVRERIVQTYNSPVPPQERDLHSLYERAQRHLRESSATYCPHRTRFVIPAGLRYNSGPFAHQGQAVSAWCEAGYNGILEMATGSGKTITAMICAYRLYGHSKPLLIVVSAPYVPLIQQWCDEISPFGVNPINLTEANGPRGRARVLGRLRRRLRNGASDVEAVVVSHRTLSDPGLRNDLKQFDCTSMLIADEAHNLGSEGFITDPPTSFDYRLGLSATPVRQYDDEGTEALFEFLGPVIFQFTLEEAVGKCLVEYEYFVHKVDLTDDEMDRWYDLTERIRQNAWRQEQDGQPDEYLTKLLRDRRAILEVAENKIAALQQALDHERISELRHTLVYASDKGPAQLDAVNKLFRDRGILFHQLTQEETRHRGQTQRIIQSFQEGTLRVLTAKRVLDEGVNIPQIQKAFILASTTVERQWVQRRGRLLRKCEEVGKTHSEVHDFVALPPNLTADDDARSLIRSELERVQEFARLARNAGRPDGPLVTIDELVQAAFT